MQTHRFSNETVLADGSTDNIQPPSGIDVRITGPSALVVALALAFWIRSRRGPTGRRRARPARRATGRLRIAT